MKPMQKHTFLVVLITSLFCLTLSAQTFVVNSGSFSVKGNTYLILNETSLINNGNFLADETTNMVMTGTSYNLEIGGGSLINAANLTLGSDCNLNAPLDLKGDLTMASGILNLNNNLIIGGKIIGEREESRISTLGSSEIITTVSLVANQPINPGNLGITITPANDYNSVEFRRGHQSISNGTIQSINRYYTLPELNEPTTLKFSYFDAELNGLSEENLVLMGEQESSWTTLQSASGNISDNLYTGISQKFMRRISLFEGTESLTIDIPTGFSPNSDGVNDFFVLPGIENFPNNRLTIINQWGDVLFEASPYQNDWGGETESGVIKTKNQILLDGTYFYFFYPDKNDKQIVKSGFVEIKTNDSN